MPYLKIIGENIKYYVTLKPFTTQHGYKAIYFIGDSIPSTNKGFKYYDDNNKIIADLSDYLFEYQPNKYSTNVDIIELPVGSNDSAFPSVLDDINLKIQFLNSTINQLIPYTNSKELYIGDTNCIFENIPQGNISIFIIDSEGNKIESTFEKINNNLIVNFEELQNAATINISIL